MTKDRLIIFLDQKECFICNGNDIKKIEKEKCIPNCQSPRVNEKVFNTNMIKYFFDIIFYLSKFIGTKFEIIIGSAGHIKFKLYKLLDILNFWNYELFEKNLYEVRSFPALKFKIEEKEKIKEKKSMLSFINDNSNECSWFK